MTLQHVKISLKWLNQFVTTDLPNETIGQYLTELGLEVEGISTYHPNENFVSTENFLIGHILECNPIEKSSHLKITRVCIGEKDSLQIVCGAPNIKSNQKVIVATKGAKVLSQKGEPIEIKHRKVFGYDSQGMICSEAELGLSDNHSGILVLDSEAEIGSKWIHPNNHELDYVYEIGLTPNRADAMSHLGVARDLVALLKVKKLKHTYLGIPKLELNSLSAERTIPVSILDSEKAPLYYGITISNLDLKPSPTWLQNLLSAIGIAPKNNVVDITNYTLHHLGQPLHAFDADKIDKQIIVKTCPEDTIFETLDGVKRKLDQEDLMICDESQPLCIAGVLGGNFSAVSEKTKAIFLESAYFDPVSIRKTAKRHGLNTDASFRFERGIDPTIGIVALKFATDLICSLAKGKVSSSIQRCENYDRNPIVINLRYPSVTQLIGKKIPKKQIVEILESLDFKIEPLDTIGWRLVVPYYRVDVTREADVIEEIFRVYGYDMVSPTPAKYFGLENKASHNHKVNNLISHYLCNQGFYEIFTNSLVPPNQNYDFFNPVKILNPIGKEFSIMRQFLGFNALEVIAYNNNRENKDVKIFEFGTIYGQDASNYHESQRLSISVVGELLKQNWIEGPYPSPFFYIKGLIEDLFSRLGINQITLNSTNNSFCEPCIEINHKDRSLGFFGLVKNQIESSASITSSVGYADLDMKLVCEIAFNEKPIFRRLPKYPSVKRDFSLLIDSTVTYLSIEEITRKTLKNHLEHIDLFDVYTGKGLPSNKMSYGISFIFRSTQGTLKDSEVDKYMQNLKETFEKELGATLRK